MMNINDAEIDFGKFKNNPRTIALMKAIHKNKIDIDLLNQCEVEKLIKCILIINR